MRSVGGGKVGDFFDFFGEVCAAEVAFENMSVGQEVPCEKILQIFGEKFGGFKKSP